MKFEPKPYQKIMIAHMAKHKRCAVWAGMGMGKTSACLLYLTYLALYDPSKILIIAPLRVARDVWPVEIKKWDAFKKMSCADMTGTVKKRICALHQNTDLHTINYENLPWLINTVGDGWKWKTVIIDESTKVKSFRLRQGGLRARALSKVAWTEIDRLIELTGTPASNSLLDLWGQLWFIDKGRRLGRAYNSFRAQFFQYLHPNSFKLIPTTFGKVQIPKRVKDVCISIRSEDWFDLKKPVHRKVPVYLTPKQRKDYNAFQRDMYLKLQDGTELTAPFAAALTMKSLQYANGAMYIEESNKKWVEVHKLKIEALDSIITEMSGENIIVAYHFKSDLARLLKYFPQGVHLDQKSETIKRWNAGCIPLLFAHPASAGHGLNLQDGGRTIVFFGHNWSLEHREQIIERIGTVRQHQSGHNRSVYVYDIYVQDTIDELVLQRHKSKQDIQEILLTAARQGGY